MTTAFPRTPLLVAASAAGIALTYYYSSVHQDDGARWQVGGATEVFSQANKPKAPGLSDLHAETQSDTLAATDTLVREQRSLGLPMGQLAPTAHADANSQLALPPDAFEQFANEQPHGVVSVAQNPVSTFSVDVDTASYSVLRSSLTSGRMPTPESVRIEEMINYFPYGYRPPVGDEQPFATAVSVFETPWNSNTQLMRIAIQGRAPDTETRPPLNLVFLIDTSGSMQAQNKLPLLVQSLKLLLKQLDPEDEVAIVTYAGHAGTVLEPTPASETRAIISALDQLNAGGSTAGQAGLHQAYAMAESMLSEGELARVILATDGDFNVGISDPDQLTDYIEYKRETGSYLSVLGFGRGNINDQIMQSLAQNGNGTAAYIDTLSEAQKVLVDQLSGALFPIADDVKIQVEFNPSTVAEYRLIGYETRPLERADFNNDRVDAGEIGAGHSVTALYEITPVGSPATLHDPLRYEPVVDPQVIEDELAFVRIRHKRPGEDVSQLFEVPVQADLEVPGEDARFAAAIAGFGQLIRDDSYLGTWGYDDAIALANGSRGEDPFGYRTEAVTLMRLAESIVGG